MANEDLFGADPELQDLEIAYRDILSAGFRSAAGDPIHPELEAAALDSIENSAVSLAAQLDSSILDAPWLRSEITGLTNDWMSQDGPLDLGDLQDALEPLFGASRALMIARSETAGAFNGASAAALKSHGWTHVVWMAAEDACEECAALDGTVMTIDEYENDPYLHPNCSCTAEPYDDSGEESVDEGDEEDVA